MTQFFLKSLTLCRFISFILKIRPFIRDDSPLRLPLYFTTVDGRFGGRIRTLNGLHTSTQVTGIFFDVYGP